MGEQEEEVLLEIEALEAVYGGDCTILNSFPPHLHLHIKPRTADISSQQFVEAVLSIKAGVQYPKEPPYIELIDSKGLDEERQKYLIHKITDTARELSSCSMLVALCEEAIESLTSMNHPDGDCPMCLDPLLQEDKHGKAVPFMKLMSCFHCFHSLGSTAVNASLGGGIGSKIREKPMPKQCKWYRALCQALVALGIEDAVKEKMGSCPVCRMVFHTKDFEHVLDLISSNSSHLYQSSSESNAVEDDNFLQSDSENTRRQKFEGILKLQQENSGLIEPKKDLLILPGMFLPQPVASAATSSTNDTNPATEETSQPERKKTALTKESDCSGSSSKPHANKHRHSHHHSHSMRRQRAQNSKQAAKQWVRKDDEIDSSSFEAERTASWKNVYLKLKLIGESLAMQAVKLGTKMKSARFLLEPSATILCA
ncbi:hypothetical protein ACFE04_018584 [Oxalis oulophora]